MTVALTDVAPPVTRIQNGDNKHIRIVIVETQRLLGEALGALLNQEPDMAVVRTVDSCNAAKVPVASLNADLAIFDFRINLRAAAGEAIRLRRAGWRAPILILGKTEDDGVLRAAIEVEASAIISDAEAAEDLIGAVRQSAGGMTLIRPERIASMLRKQKFRDDRLHRLSRRESEILSLLGHGVSSREIASRLAISYLTVRSHVRNLARKLAAHSKLEMVAKAHQLGLLTDTVVWDSDLMAQDAPP
jgi:DNA-binding NarL/FixJ family response regulator